MWITLCLIAGPAKPETVWVSAIPSSPVPDGSLQGGLARVRVLQDWQHHRTEGGMSATSISSDWFTSLFWTLRNCPTRCWSQTECTLRQVWMIGSLISCRCYTKTYILQVLHQNYLKNRGRVVNYLNYFKSRRIIKCQNFWSQCPYMLRTTPTSAPTLRPWKQL